MARAEFLPVLGPRVVNRLPVGALARLFAAAGGHCGILALPPLGPGSEWL